MRIETERLVLRLPRPEDVDELGAIFAEPDTMYFVGGTVASEDMPARIANMRQRWDDRGFGTLVAERREDGRIVGDFGVYAWAVRNWALRGLQPPRLISLINVDNVASSNVARRLGCAPGGRVETAKYGTSEIWVHP
jgi:RimJ/RimL family protein N-acetyltransferase